MESVTITIKTENDAFADGNAEREVARILRQLADDFSNGHRPQGAYSMMDANGNKVGKVIVK